jgi:hypothetical protein
VILGVGVGVVERGGRLLGASSHGADHRLLHGRRLVVQLEPIGPRTSRRLGKHFLDLCQLPAALCLNCHAAAACHAGLVSLGLRFGVRFWSG